MIIQKNCKLYKKYYFSKFSSSKIISVKKNKKWCPIYREEIQNEKKIKKKERKEWSENE